MTLEQLLYDYRKSIGKDSTSYLPQNLDYSYKHIISTWSSDVNFPYPEVDEMSLKFENKKHLKLVAYCIMNGYKPMQWASTQDQGVYWVNKQQHVIHFHP